MIELDTFLKLPTEEIAAIVRQNGPKVCVFPINGTRRWFTLEHGHEAGDDPIAAYMDITMRRHIEMYKLFFDHGIDVLLTPVIGPEILETRDAYMQKIGANGLERIATHPEFLAFYKEYKVRARFYGDYQKYLTGTPYEHISDRFDELGERTKTNKGPRLLFGAFADNLNATQTAAKFAVDYHKKHGQVPDRKAIVEMYYGEDIEKAHIFIGFDRFAAFDYPFLNWGEEDLYFTVSPSLYLEADQLRTILYDHLYTRRTPEQEYDDLAVDELGKVREYYQNNVDNIKGIGELRYGFWVPKY
jgi:tuberculosinol/isotuberculosinol synthase